MLLHKSVEFDSRVRREASALAADGHEVFVLELASDVRTGALDGFVRRSCLPPRWLRTSFPSVLYRIAIALYFAREIARLRPEIVHAHDAAMLIPGFLGARQTGARLVYDSHELATGVPYRERGWAWLVAAIERMIVPRCAAVITVSDGIARELQRRYGLAVMPTAVRNVSALEPSGEGGLRRRLGLGPEVALVLHQGAPAPDRGCELLVEATARVDDVHVAFLGDPEPGYGERLAALIVDRGLSDRVSMLPSVPLDQLLAHTAEADLGVTLLQDTCENHRLALPNKLFEYIAADVPVIASALPESERLINHYGVGWCVAPGDPDALAATMTQALREADDPELHRRLGQAARELRWAVEQTRLLELYRGLQDGASEPARPSVLLLVRNSVTHDARVLRAARAAERALEAPALVIGTAGVDAPAGETTVEGVRVRRLAPLGRVRRPPLRRVRRPPVGRVRRGRELSPTGAPAPAAGSARPARTTRLPPRARLRRIVVGLSFIAQALITARRARPRLVHANDWNTMWAGVAIKRLCGTRLIYDSHELWADRNGRWEWRPWLVASEALFVRIADEVITTSPGHAQALAARYRIPTPLVVRNIPEWVTAQPTRPYEPPRIVYLGGLMPGRGLEEMIETLPHLPTMTLRAIGPGAEAYRQHLRALADRFGVADRVQLLDSVPPPAVPSVLAGAAVGLCLIQPVCRSYELSLPNKLFEYVAAGVPVLASDLPCIADLVDRYGFGVVVAPNGPPAIAAGIERLLAPGSRSHALAGARAFTAANSSAGELAVLGRAYGRVMAPR